MDQVNNTGSSEQTLELVEHEGVVITLGKRQYVLPPMSLKVRKQEISTRKSFGVFSPGEEQALMLQVVVQTLQRNYPHLTADVIEEEASIVQLTEAYAALAEQEQRLLEEVGKRIADRGAAMVAAAQAANAR